MKLAALALAMACTLGAVTLEEIARLAPKEPVRPAPKALKDAVRAWAEPQFLTVRNPLPVAVAMKAAMERAGLGMVVEDVRLLHPSGQREFVVLVTKVASNCGSDYSLHLYRWKSTSWRHLLTNENHGETHRTAPMYDPTPFIRLSEPDGAGERLFAVGGFQQDCTSCWHTFFYRVWLLAGEEPELLLDRRPVGYVCSDEFDIAVSASSVTVRMMGDGPNSVVLTAPVSESYERRGAGLYLSHRTPTRLLEDLDEDLEGDPLRYLLQWLEERIAPPGDLDYRVTDLNAKLGRFQLPKAVAPARVELLPGSTRSQAELVLHTAGKQTRATVEYRNGQWELEPERP
ncbi:MAG: hypothetical protein IPJ98_07820 [Bryobacterales bacterium]|nr:hypothetical protein [Bryobacterales bacterium]